MSVFDYLSDDGQVLVLLCSGFALPTDAATTGLVPFKLSEWNQLARRIHDSALSRPSALLGLKPTDLATALTVPAEDAERIVRLLERAPRAALELENLFGRGLWVITRADTNYPARLRGTLKHQAPAVLFGAGEVSLLRQSGVAIVGSRDVDEAGTRFAQEVARQAVAAGRPVVSGGARGTDRIAMQAALDASGIAFGALADSLDRTVRQPDLRELLQDRRLVLVTPFLPTAGFSIGTAMGRNKIIYGLSEYAVIASSDHATGGTWAGAEEALKGKWCPLYVRAGENVPKGNRELIKLGATGLEPETLAEIKDLPAWFEAHRPQVPVEMDLFASGKA